jgi:hypothetical protein
METMILAGRTLSRFAQRAGPYLLALLLPGGSLVALALFLYRRRAA